MTMNGIITNQWIKVIVLTLLVLITPLLVLGDVHLKHENDPCEDGQDQEFVDSLPWHPHGSCASDVENEHFDLNSLVQKSNNINHYEIPILSCAILTHDHSECQQATQVVDNVSYSSTEDLLQVLSIFLI